MKKIKIAHVQVIPIMSGVQTVSYNILKELPDDQYEKFMICGFDEREEPKFFSDFSDINVKVIQVKSFRRQIGKLDFQAMKEISKILKENSFDIVHTNSTKPGVLVRILSRVHGVNKIIHTVHGIAFHNKEKFFKRSLYYLLEAFSSLFGHVNVTVNKCYTKYYPYLKSNNNICIYNGVDFKALDESFVNQGVKQYKNEGEPIRIVFMGRLDSQKDPITLLKSANELINKRGISNVHFYFGGDGELYDECHSYIKNNNLSEHVTLLGWVTDKSGLLSKCDIFSMPSIYEAFGLVFVEAAHFSLPSVSTRVEGIPEVILDGETGLLVSEKDHIALSDKLELLITDSKLRKKFGKEAKIRAHREFSLDQMVQKYRALYEN